MFSGDEEQKNDVFLYDLIIEHLIDHMFILLLIRFLSVVCWLYSKKKLKCVCVSLQGNGGTGPSSAEESIEDIVGGTYVRFDAPKAKIRKSWPGVRGTLCFNPVYSLLNYPLT